MIIIYLCIFFLGASLASFLNATTYRIDNGYKYPEIVKSNSHCEKCKHVLTWWELFPILGYIFIKGKCTSCKSNINMYYPLSEFFLGITFLLLYLNSITWYVWIVIMFLLVLSYHDIKYKAIPRNIVHIFLLLCILFFLSFNFDIYNIYLPLIISLLFFLINMIKKSFGLGDILILFGIGILLNPKQYIVMFWLSIFLALLYSLIWIVKEKMNIKKAKVPMIPFITISFVISVIYGELIYSLLLKYMGIW